MMAISHLISYSRKFMNWLNISENSICLKTFPTKRDGWEQHIPYIMYIQDISPEYSGLNAGGFI